MASSKSSKNYDSWEGTVIMRVTTMAHVFKLKKVKDYSDPDYELIILDYDGNEICIGLYERQLVKLYYDIFGNRIVLWGEKGMRIGGNERIHFELV